MVALTLPEDRIRGSSLALRWAAIGAAPVQVDKDVAWFGAIAWADNAAILKLVHDAGGPAVAEPQAAL
jgi:hypothetical protein